MRKILVPVRGDGKGDNVFAHAVALARGFNAHVQVTHCRSRPEDLIPYGVAVSPEMKKQIIDQSTEILNIQEQGLRDEITALAKANGAEMSEKNDRNKVTVSFIEEQGRQIDVIRHYGLISDMTAVAKPDRDRNIGTNTLQAALFSTGRPVMMCPEPKGKLPKQLGKNIAIAWDGSVAASRAVVQTMPLLGAADDVTIITNTSEPIKVSPEELQDYLSDHGVEAKIVLTNDKGDVGASILSKAAESRAEILVLGAYSSNKNLERVVGGVTQHVVDHASMPVIFVN